MAIDAQRRVAGRALPCLALVGFVVMCGNLAAASGDVRLLEAAKKRDTDTVRHLLEQRVDVNVAQPDGATALHWAVYWDDVDIADRLLRAGASASAANEYGVTPLSLACTNRNAAMVDTLLQAGASANATLTETGETVLMTCARTGTADAVEALLAKGANVNAKEVVEEQTALMWAVSQRHPDITKLLLAHGADVHARSRPKPWTVSRTLQSDLNFAERPRKYGTDAVVTQRGGYTALLFAARSGDLDSARLLLAAGAEVDTEAADGTSALVLAAHSGHGALATLLLEKGADPNHAGAGYSALHAAVMTDDLALVKALVAAGANPNMRMWQATPVTRNGQVLMLADYLLGVTPFGLAAKFVETEMLRVLADKGDASVATDKGWTPLMLAAGAGWRIGSWDRRDRAALFPEVFIDQQNEAGTLDAVKVLVDELYAEVNAVDAEGNTALHHAVTTDFTGLVQFLVDKGANSPGTPSLEVKNNRGLTPLAIAVGAGRRGGEDRPRPESKVVKLLRTLGAPEK